MSARLAAAWLAVLALLGAVPAQAQSLDLDTLMHALALQTSGRATFTESKTLALLDRPVVSSGELSFRAPDHFEKRTLLPKPENLVVDGDTLTITRNGQQHSLSLVQYPEIAAGIESVRGTLGGERATLEQFYTVTLSGTAAQWHLLLVPRDAKVARQIARITLSGTAPEGRPAQLQTVQIDQSNRDRTVTTITPAAP